jgi:hypothetical protein
MDIHSSIIRDEVKELEYEFSVNDLIKFISSDKTLIDINNVLEEIAIDRIIVRSQKEKRGKI